MAQVSTIKRFIQAQIPTALTTIYTINSTNGGILKEIILTNTAAASASISLNIVPSAGTLGVANAILSSMLLQPHETKVISLSVILANGDTFQVSSDTNNVIGVTLSGVTVA